MSILELIEKRLEENFALHEQYLNPQMVRVLKTIGYDRHYVKAQGAYLFDNHGEKYLDLLSGFGVFALGRNHPKIVQALQEVLTAALPNLVQLDASILAGLLAERLAAIAPPGLERVFFANSGTETVEAANELPRRKRTGYQNQNRLNCRFWCSCRYSLSCSFTYLAIIPSSPCFPTVLA